MLLLQLLRVSYAIVSVVTSNGHLEGFERTAGPADTSFVWRDRRDTGEVDDLQGRRTKKPERTNQDHSKHTVLQFQGGINMKILLAAYCQLTAGPCLQGCSGAGWSPPSDCGNRKQSLLSNSSSITTTARHLRPYGAWQSWLKSKSTLTHSCFPQSALSNGPRVATKLTL